jgi:Flp pilus assembly protein TadG
MVKSNYRKLDAVDQIPGFRSGTYRTTLKKGQSSVEFAMVSILFFLLLFGIMDFGWLMFAQMNIQQAVDDGGRYASTGQQTGTSGTRITSIISTIQNEISVPGVTVGGTCPAANCLSICSVPPGGTTSSCFSATNPTGTAGAAGGPEYTTTISLTTTIPLMTPLIGQFFPAGGYKFTSSSTFQNEPFNPSTTQ